MTDISKLPERLYNLLCTETFEFGELLDTRENIEAPIDQLSPNGQYIVMELHNRGITTPEDVDQLECELEQYQRTQPPA